MDPSASEIHKAFPEYHLRSLEWSTLVKIILLSSEKYIMFTYLESA